MKPERISCRRNFREPREDGVNRDEGNRETSIEKLEAVACSPSSRNKACTSVVDRKIKAGCARGSCVCRGGNIAYPFPIMRLHENTGQQIFQACTTKIPKIARDPMRLRRFVKYSPAMPLCLRWIGANCL